jgi:hypothetical protein
MESVLVMSMLVEMDLQESDTLGAISEAGVAGMAPGCVGRDAQRM